MLNFEKQNAEIPDCCRTELFFPELKPFKHLRNLPGDPTNAHKKAAKRLKWDVIKDDWRNIELLKSWPELKTLVDTFPALRVRKAHISEMVPESRLTIHRDGYFKETDKPQSRFNFFNKTLRFHVPLKTNERSWIYCAGKFYKMYQGECWMLNNFKNHSAINMNKQHSRFHLILDVVPNQETMKLINQSKADFGVEKPQLKARLKEKI